jgi:peptide-methionine (S)-S-oxide reductase
MSWFSNTHKTRMPDAAEALPGRDAQMPVPDRHAVLGTPLQPPYPAGTEIARVRDGLFLGRREAVLAGSRSRHYGRRVLRRIHPRIPRTKRSAAAGPGQIETVRVVFDPARVSYAELMKLFWEEHDPTQGMRQGNDAGTQYRSAILTHGEAQQREAEASRSTFQAQLNAAGHGTITTEIRPAPEFYFAEAYHQQYLYKNPNGYCPNHATGVTLPEGFFKSEGAARRVADAAKAIEQAR